MFEAFRMNCVAHPRKVMAVWYEDATAETVRWTYGDLWARARAIAAVLERQHGVRRGDRVLMVYEPCVDFFTAFWALVGLGAIAVPVCPPDPFSPTADATDKLLAVTKDAEPKLILTSRKYKDTLAAARTFLGAEFQAVLEEKEHILDFSRRVWVSTDDIPVSAAGSWTFPSSELTKEDDVVFLQYTSGSTGGAKGVMVQHKTLMANCMNCALLTQGLGSIYTYQFSLGVSWLPTFHDMGLIGFHVAPVVIGGTMIYFSPITFIQNPVMWLQVISKFRHVSSGAPPFALDLCARRVTPKELQALDLSGLEILVLGAEPIRASYMEEFGRRFAPYGFNPRAYMTCYGMAENVLHVAGKWSNQYEARKILVDSALLNRNRLAVYRDEIVALPAQAGRPYLTARAELLAPLAAGADKDAQWLVSSGELINFDDPVTVDPENHADLRARAPHFYRREVASYIVIVNPDSQEEVADGTVGEIWIASPSRTAGYWNKPELNERNFRALLRRAVKGETQALLTWAQTKGRYLTGTVDPDTVKLEDVKRSREPVVGFLENCVDKRTGDVHWMRSGDMGVVFDNNIFITGRIKDMIIIRGQNFYADDLEHCITSGNFRGADVSAGAKTTALTRDPSLQALSALRPGSAIAYSITIPSDGTATCAATQTRTEGEHLAVVVELRADPNEDDDDESDGDDASASASASAGANSDSDDDNGDAAVSASAKSVAGIADGGRVRRKRKSGNQMPLWQRVLMRYGGPIVSGMSALYERNEQAVHAQTAHEQQQSGASGRRGMGCAARAKLIAQHSMVLAVKRGIDTAKYISAYLNPQQATRDAVASRDASAAAAANGALSAGAVGDGESKNKAARRHLPMDADTQRVRARYTDAQLEQVASAVRRAISIKFMLVVGQIIFISPKTIKKTSSGKKRRSDTTKAIGEGLLDHRIVKRCYSKSIEAYLKLKGGLALGLKRTEDVTAAAISASTVAAPAGGPASHTAGSYHNAQLARSTNATGAVVSNTAVGTNARAAPASSSTSSSISNHGSINQQQQQQQGHFGGTVGVSLGGADGAYLQPGTYVPGAHGAHGAHHGGGAGGAVPGVVYNSGDRYQLAPMELLPPRASTAAGVSGAVSREEAWAAVEAVKRKAAATRFDDAKRRILGIVVAELKEAQAGSAAADGEDEETARQTRAFTRGDGAPREDASGVTVEYLEQMARLPADSQQRKLDEYGLDSMTGFKLAKSLAREFDLPASMMGPHLFLQDPTIDGMVQVMVNLVHLQATRAEEDFKREFDTPKPSAVSSAAAAAAGSANSAQTVHESAAAQAYRSTPDADRVPYVLAIGTAVPRTCAPQSELLGAMIPPMRLDARAQERFMKIGNNSGVHTRYSVLDSLDDIFWGKEGVNTDSDEYIDARQEVYKRESVRLSVQSSIDCLHDWLGARKLKTDDERSAERLDAFLDLERRHTEAQQKKAEKKCQADADAASAAAAAASTGTNAGASASAAGKKGGKRGGKHSASAAATAADEEEEEEAKCAPGAASAAASSASASAAAPRCAPERPLAGNGIDKEDHSYLSNLAQTRLGRTITHVVAVTCTGVIVPGLEFYIMQALGLPTGTQRLSIQFMGCFGAISGIRCASALAAENPRNRVLVVCTELCTLHMQLNDRVDNLIATALFADGSGAFIVGCAPTPAERPLFSVQSCSSYVIPGTLDQMAWEMTKTGLHIGLAKEIAGEIFTCIGDFLNDMLKYSADPKAPQHRVRAADCNCAVHPGGPLIINTIQNVLGIEQVGDGHGGGEIDPAGPTAETWTILRDYGNMSSATLVFVLDRIRENDEKRAKWTPTIAFGPGLNIEGALLKACFPGRAGTEQWQRAHGAELTRAIDDAKKAHLARKAAITSASAVTSASAAAAAAVTTSAGSTGSGTAITAALATAVTAAGGKRQ